ncbi:MAG: methylenetetrahydrofolate reductase [Burkholderiales bacterium]|nr:methylenetetrahydrofolate reductase [Burkholderiales bacterium]
MPPQTSGRSRDQLCVTRGETMQNAAASGHDRRQQIIDFMSGFTLETTPGSAAKVPDFRAHVRAGATIFITFLQGSEFTDTIRVARRLKAEGFNPVPHISARGIPDRRYLEQSLAMLAGEIGIREVLCIAGANSDPVGEYGDTMQLLETGLFDKYGISRIGLAGHPEGIPAIPEKEITQALEWKNAYARRTGAALYLVTQFCFEAEPVIAWDKLLQTQGNRLPIYIGIPGLATIRTLLGHAKACGIGPSMRFISRQAMNVARLMTISAPDKLVAELAAYKASDARCGIAGVHLYPLGGLKKSADWAYAVVDGNFTLSTRNDGFDVEVPPA